MDFYDAVGRRRMVRNYEDRPVDPAAVTRMVEAAAKAPSAGFSQGHEFVVVTDPARRADIARIAGEEAYVAHGFDPWISRAPVHIVVTVREATYRERYAEPDKAADDAAWPVPYWWVDAGTALMTLLLAAPAEGLAAGFLGVHAMPDLKEYLGIPEDVSPIGIVTVGHPAPDRRSGSLDRGRRPIDEIVHREAW